MKDQHSALSPAEIAEHLSYIKTVTIQKKSYGKQTGPFLVLWGIIWVIGFLITITEQSSIILWSWIILGLVGWLLTFVLYFKQEKNEGVPTLLRNQLRMVLIGCAFVLIVFLFLITSNILPVSFHLMFFYMTLLISIMYVFLGSVFGKELSYIGIWIGILSMITLTWFPLYSTIIYAIIGGGSLILSGVWLVRWGKDHE